VNKHRRTYSELEKQFSEKNSSYVALQERVKDLEDENDNLKYKLAEADAEIRRKEQEIRKQTTSTTADIETSINDLSNFVIRNVPLH
jgi:chromosome segregation ATPase